MDGTIKVLLIEDNPGDARLIQEELSGEIATFFDIVTVESLKDGIKSSKTDSFNIVLLDLSLPDSTGSGTFIKFHNEGKHLPTIVLSSTKDEKLALDAVKNGAQDYLIKGEIDSRLLVKSIRYAIERHKINNELERIKTELNKYKTYFEKKTNQTT